MNRALPSFALQQDHRTFNDAKPFTFARPLPSLPLPVEGYPVQGETPWLPGSADADDISHPNIRATTGLPTAIHSLSRVALLFRLFGSAIELRIPPWRQPRISRTPRRSCFSSLIVWRPRCAVEFASAHRHLWTVEAGWCLYKDRHSGDTRCA